MVLREARNGLPSRHRRTRGPGIGPSEAGPAVSNATLAKICAVLIFDCLIASGLIGVDDFGPLGPIASGILLLQPFVFFNWGLLELVRRNRQRFSIPWIPIAAAGVAAVAFAILWPPTFRILIYPPGSPKGAHFLQSPSPIADMHLVITGFVWFYFREYLRPDATRAVSASSSA